MLSSGHFLFFSFILRVAEPIVVLCAVRGDFATTEHTWCLMLMLSRCPTSRYCDTPPLILNHHQATVNTGGRANKNHSNCTFHLLFYWINFRKKKYFNINLKVLLARSLSLACSPLPCVVASRHFTRHACAYLRTYFSLLLMAYNFCMILHFLIYFFFFPFVLLHSLIGPVHKFGCSNTSFGHNRNGIRKLKWRCFRPVCFFSLIMRRSSVCVCVVFVYFNDR